MTLEFFKNTTLHTNRMFFENHQNRRLVHKSPTKVKPDTPSDYTISRIKKHVTSPM
jgi:hypothetical protein